MMMGFGLIIVVLIVGFIGLVIAGVVALVAGWRPASMEQKPSRENEQTPLEILKARYARGEISQEEYQQMRRNLES